jgi:hypothetical protein
VNSTRLLVQIHSTQNSEEFFAFIRPPGSRLTPVMRPQSLEFLKTLVNTPSPVGHETGCASRGGLRLRGIEAREHP